MLESSKPGRTAAALLAGSSAVLASAKTAVLTSDRNETWLKRLLRACRGRRALHDVLLRIAVFLVPNFWFSAPVLARPRDDCIFLPTIHRGPKTVSGYALSCCVQSAYIDCCFN